MATSYVDRFIITSEGNVGIDVVTPGKRLDVGGVIRSSTVISDLQAMTALEFSCERLMVSVGASIVATSTVMDSQNDRATGPP